MTTALLPSIHEAYPIAEAGIEELAAQYGTLKIAGLQDKGGFEQVHKARMVVKGYRVDIEKARKELKAEVLERGRAIDSRAKELTALISPVETHLEAEEKAYTEAHEAIKREAEEKRQAVLVDKVNRLAAVGFQSTTYAVESWTDEQFETTLAEATKTHAAEQERLAKERAEQEQQRARQTLGMARAQELIALGEDGKFHESEDEVDFDRLGAIPEDVWEQAIGEVRANKVRRDAEAAAEAKRLAEEREALEAERRKLAEEKAAAEQAERERLAAEKARQDERDRIEREKRDAEERAKAEAAEKARLESLKPDKEKLLDVAAKVAGIEVPPLSSDDSSVLDAGEAIRIILIDAANDITKAARGIA